MQGSLTSYIVYTYKSMMIPTYLNDLELPQVFSLSSQEVGKYVHESTKDEHIVDSESQKISGFVSATFGTTEDDALKYFTIENPTASPYALLQVDNGLIKSHDVRKCDCAIVNETYIGFIEFKANATSDSDVTIKKNYLKAMEQLKATIETFNKYYELQGRDIKSCRSGVEAFICFRQGYPKTNSSQINYRVRFKEENGIPLSFERKKIL